MTSDASSAEINLHRALALQTVGDGHLTATVYEGWDVRGVPHGGYLLAMLAAAAGTVAAQPDPLTIAATYLAPPEFGTADLTVAVIRAGRRQTTVEVSLRQQDVERVRAMVTMGDLDGAVPIPLADDAVMPAGPGLDDCPPLTVPVTEGPPIRLHERMEVRLHPETSFVRGGAGERAQLDGWLRLADGTPPDPLALLVFSDGFPPSIFEARGPGVGHVPTIQLTTHLFGRPEPGWVRKRCRTRVQGGSFLDEDADLWDGAGRLVGTARQLALLR